MAKQAHTIIAEMFCMDSRDVFEMRHHYGQTKQPIYVIGDDYFAVGKNKPTENYGTGWIHIGSVHGRNVWKSEC